MSLETLAPSPLLELEAEWVQLAHQPRFPETRHPSFRVAADSARAHRLTRVSVVVSQPLSTTPTLPSYYGKAPRL